MRPFLEQLETRDCPSAGIGSWDVVHVNVPHNFNDMQAKVFIQFFLNSQVILGQLGLSPAWSPDRIYAFDLGDSLFTEMTTYPPITTTRILASVIGGGQIPITYEPSSGPSFDAGLRWEEAAFNNGWPQTDPQKSDFPGDVYNLAQFPQGPAFGVPFAAPNPFMVDWLLMNGYVLWPYQSPLDAAFSPWL